MSAAADFDRPPDVAKVSLQPFFLIGALYAALMMALGAPWFLGFIQVPSAWPAQAWFAHELVLGVAPAIVAGVLLMISSKEERSRTPLGGVALAAVAMLWITGRVGMGFSAHLDAVTTAALSIAFPIVLAMIAARAISARGDRWTLVIVTLLVGLGLADALFHYEMWEFGRPKFAQSLAIAFVLLLLMVIANRMTSVLAKDLKADDHALSVLSVRYDTATLAVSAVAIMAWAAMPLLQELFFGKLLVGTALLLAASMVVVSQLRCAKRPLVGFHFAYAFVALGFVLTGLGVLWNDYDFATGGLNAWTVGAVGAMALAVSACASRARRSPSAPGTIVLYVLGSISGLAWTIAALYPQWTLPLLPISGVSWIAAFAGFAVLYGLRSPSSKSL